MFQENAIDYMLMRLFGIPVLAGILCLWFKKWRGKIVHYTAIGLAVMVVVMYFVSIL